MPRLPRLVLPGIPHNNTQCGNCRIETCFRAEDDRLYLQLLKDLLIPNHVHLVAVPRRPNFWAAFLYVEQNPARVRLVEHSKQWKWSSAQTRGLALSSFRG